MRREPMGVPRHDILDKLGSGTFGDVWRARTGGRLAALKGAREVTPRKGFSAALTRDSHFARILQKLGVNDLNVMSQSARWLIPGAAGSRPAININVTLRMRQARIGASLRLRQHSIVASGR